MSAKPSGKPARGWDATSHEDLLLALLEEVKPSRAQLTTVAEKMRKKGYNYSFDAIKYSCFLSVLIYRTSARHTWLTFVFSQHVQKLRKNRDTAGIQNAGENPATPRKPKASGTKTPAKTPKKRTKAAAEEEDEDMEDEKLQLKKEPDLMEDGMPSPSPKKRARTTTPKAEPKDDLSHGQA
ncbi:hypothetical protein F66182_9129 [Fusarium sp. NRRL 66182]|nr:hypothetical protein F66182_9129 [Fusarium sp. NRRL 66182]